MNKEDIMYNESTFDARFSMPDHLQEEIAEIYQQYSDGLLSRFEYAKTAHIATSRFIANLDREIDSYRRQLRG